MILAMFSKVRHCSKPPGVGPAADSVPDFSYVADRSMRFLEREQAGIKSAPGGKVPVFVSGSGAL